MPTGGRGAIRRGRQERDREYQAIMQMMARDRIEKQVAEAMEVERPRMAGKGNRYVGHLGSQASSAEWAARDAYLEDPEALADDGRLICEACGEPVPLLEFRDTGRAIHIRCSTARKTVPHRRRVGVIVPPRDDVRLYVDGKTGLWCARVRGRSVVLRDDWGKPIAAFRGSEPDGASVAQAERAAKRLRQEIPVPRRSRSPKRTESTTAW